jgi:ATP-dependent DNA helicase RecQ
LRELARIRPSSLERLRLISGIGEARLHESGQRILSILDDHCTKRGLSRDLFPAPVWKNEPPRPSSRPNPARDQAFQLFREQAVVEDVMHQTGKARSTVNDYLCEFIRETRPASLFPWVAPAVVERVTAAVRKVGMGRLKPIYEELGEKISYDEIRAVVAYLSWS